MTIKETVLFTKKKSDWWQASSVTKQQSQSKDHLDPRQSTGGPGRTAAPPPEPRKGNASNPRGRPNPTRN